MSSFYGYKRECPLPTATNFTSGRANHKHFASLATSDLSLKKNESRTFPFILLMKAS